MRTLLVIYLRIRALPGYYLGATQHPRPINDGPIHCEVIINEGRALKLNLLTMLADSTSRAGLGRSTSFTKVYVVKCKFRNGLGGTHLTQEPAPNFLGGATELLKRWNEERNCRCKVSWAEASKKLCAIRKCRAFPIACKHVLSSTFPTNLPMSWVAGSGSVLGIDSECPAVDDVDAVVVVVV